MLLFFIIFGSLGARVGTYLWSGNCLLAARFILGIKYVVKGNMPNYPAIYASRHESAWETAFLQLVVKRPVFILKRELLWIPFFNLFMIAAGYIGVNRGKGAGALKQMVKLSKKSIAKGNSIIIFPEGTRVKRGEKAPIKPGVVALYSMSEIPMIPVSLNSGQFWGRNSFIKKPGTIIVTFHPPIERNLPKKLFVEKLGQIISEA